MMSACAISCK